MISRALLVIATLVGFLPLQQDTSNQELARRLSSEDSRAAAISEIVASRSTYFPVLLRWTENPPAGVDKHQLYVGMSDAFGKLKAKEAIPFLIKILNLGRYLDKPDIWTKGPPIIEQNLPAVAALISIGPDASDALISAFGGPMTPRDRLAVIFIVARIKSPDSRAFLSEAIGEADTERFWADDGIEFLATHQ